MEQIEQIRKLAELSKIELEREELELLAGQMQGVMELMDRVKTIDLPEEASRPAPLSLVELREDAVQESGFAGRTPDMASDAAQRRMTVPKIV